MRNQDMSLVLSTDPKPRLKWTPELHQRFVEAVNQLGGPEKATPKSLMRMMGIPGLTLYHLKSHLQKFRLGKNQQSETCSDFNQDVVADYKDSPSMNELDLFRKENGTNDTTQDQIKENVRIAHAIQMQMEVQRKLHEQIEVQRHLQLRIEAQGKYLQIVLKKAQETLSGYNCSSAGVENAKAELSQLVSMVSSSSFSDLTEITDLSLDNLQTRRGRRCSNESSLTSSESSWRREENHEETKMAKKRSKSANFEGNFGKETSSKRSREAYREEEMGHGLRKLGLLETFDLNTQYQCENDLDLGLKQPIDLNSQVKE